MVHVSVILNLQKRHMYMPLRPTPKGGTLRCCLCKLDNKQKLADQTTKYNEGKIHRNKQMIMSMRKESGEITTNREEILKICANFYKSLYTQTVPTPESTMKSSPDTEEIPEFTEEEVERAIKRMKRHKAQGVE